mgnify:CR=1 FL=1
MAAADRWIDAGATQLAVVARDGVGEDRGPADQADGRAEQVPGGERAAARVEDPARLRGGEVLDPGHLVGEPVDLVVLGRVADLAVLGTDLASLSRLLHDERMAALAGPGDRVLLLGPRVSDNRSVCFRPPDGTDLVVLAADETALPATEGILITRLRFDRDRP